MKAINKIAFVLGTLSLGTLFTACRQNIPEEQKDWENTTVYFPSSDEPVSTTYYKPSAGSVGDPLPFYDPVAKEYKILYLHNFVSISNSNSVIFKCSIFI